MKKSAFAALVLALICACKSSSPAAQGTAATMAAAQTVAQPKWVNFTDTAEGAFSMDVPVGWQVQGGMYRFGYFDVRWMMNARSLDGKIVLRIDDVNIPPYTVPGPSTGKDGQPYTKPQQFQMMVSAYKQAAAYGEPYARKRFASVCQSMTAKTPAWTPTMPADWAVGAGAQMSSASLAFDCATSDGPREVDVYLHTTLFPQTGLWTVDPALSIIATPANLPLARSMTQHMIDSWQVNPQWKTHQDQITQMGLQQITAAFQQFMQQMRAFDQQRQATMNQQVAGFEAQQNAQAAQVSQWGDILTGVTNVSDPMTGTQFQVFSGPNANYYTNGAGVTVNSNLSPGSDFHQVTPMQ
jgi:hypothetical protein